MLKISFLGDISLNNNYNQLYKSNINPFLGVEEILMGSDFNIGNLECLARGDNGENLLKSPRLNTDAETLNLLDYLNLKVVTLAHNHIYDNLKDGYDKTISLLKGKNIKFLGAGLNKIESEKELYINKNGVKLGLLNFVTHDTNPKLPKNATICLNFFDIESVEKKIKEIKLRVDHVIILLHWGGKVEEGFYPDFKQPVLARRMIDAGADLIVGGHSHTIQPYELYKDKYIFYSLGNFCFDDIVQDKQTFQIGRFRKRETIIPTVIFTKNNYSLKIKHAKNNKGHVVAENNITSRIKIKWRNFIFSIIRVNYSLWKIYYWHLKSIVPIKMYFVEANEGITKKLVTLDFKRVLRYLLKQL